MRAVSLDSGSPDDILQVLHRGQMEAAAAVTAGLEQIAKASKLAADSLSAGKRIAYVGAGSSGLLAMADGLELPGTFGISPEQITMILAGGVDSYVLLDSASEDDEDQAESQIKASGLGKGDCAILVSASGSTPFTVAASNTLRKSGASTIAIANNPDAPLLRDADIPICLPTPPEVLAGSTRMGAGTAQKIALNMFSTLVGVHLGHVHDGLMVNLVAENEKLRQRAIGIVSEISGCSRLMAHSYLEQANGSAKLAVLLAKGVGSLEDANRLLNDHGGKLKNCFAALAS